MEINGRKIKLNKSEINGSCPLDPSWAASMMDRYGIEIVSASRRMSHLAKCPDVLEAAGYEVEIVEDQTGMPDVES